MTRVEPSAVYVPTNRGSHSMPSFGYLLRLSSLALALLGGGCQGRTQTNDGDSNSNWLDKCVADEDCSGNASCVDQRCVKRQQPADASEPLAPTRADSGVNSKPSKTPNDAGSVAAPAQSEDATTAPPAMSTHPGPSPSNSSLPIPLSSSSPAPDTSSPVPAPSSSTVPAPTSPDECPVIADHCPSSCVAVSGSPIAADLGCYGPSVILGCSSGGSVVTNALCIRSTIDGSLYYPLSGTYAGPLTQTSEYEACSDAETQRAVEATGMCESPPVDPIDAGCPNGLAPDGTCNPPSVLYSGKLTNGIDCCDFYTLIRSDAALGSCVVVEVTSEPGNARATNAYAFSTDGDCWDAIGAGDPDAGVRRTANSIQGEVNFDGQLADFDLTLEFSQPPQGLSSSLQFQSASLPIDGNWYSAP